MTCVVGMIDNGGDIILGSDGIAVTGEGDRRPIIAKKIYSYKKMIIGFAGSVRMGQVLRPEYFKPPKTKKKNFQTNLCTSKIRYIYLNLLIFFIIPLILFILWLLDILWIHFLI